MNWHWILALECWCPLYNQFTCIDTALELWSCWMCALNLVLSLYCFALQDIALELWSCWICALIWPLLCNYYYYYLIIQKLGKEILSMNVSIVNTKRCWLSYKVLCITFALQILSTRIGLAIVLVWYSLKKKIKHLVKVKFRYSSLSATFYIL